MLVKFYDFPDYLSTLVSNRESSANTQFMQCYFFHTSIIFTMDCALAIDSSFHICMAFVRLTNVAHLLACSMSGKNNACRSGVKNLGGLGLAIPFIFGA